MAARRLDGSASPVPAMSKAVPWSTLVRKKGKPTVTLTPVSKPMSFMGMCPWSWYCTTTMSNAPVLARIITVSGGCGPVASMPSSTAAATAGAMLLRILGAEEPVLPGVGVQAGDGDLGVLDAELSQRLVGEADDGQLSLGLDALYGLPERDVGRDVDHLQLVGDEHHRVVLACR